MQKECKRHIFFFFPLFGFVALPCLVILNPSIATAGFISCISDYVFFTVLKSLNVWADYILISFFYNLLFFFSIFILTEESGNVPFQQNGILYWSGFITWHTSKLKGCPEHTELNQCGTVLTNTAWLSSCALETNRIVDSCCFLTEVSYMQK